MLAEAFARRGAGTCAISPSRFSANLVGVTESFDVRPSAVIGGVQFVEGSSCDGDGFLDAGESAALIVTVMNGGPMELADTTVSLTSSLAGVLFPNGNVVRIARIAPFTGRQLSIHYRSSRPSAASVSSRSQ